MFTDDLRNRFGDVEQRAFDRSGTYEYTSVAARSRKRKLTQHLMTDKQETRNWKERTNFG